MYRNVPHSSKIIGETFQNLRLIDTTQLADKLQAQVYTTTFGKVLTFNKAYQGIHASTPFYKGGLPYNKYFNIPLLLTPQPPKILILGLGVGSCVQEFIQQYHIPPQDITIVEKYPQVLHIAETHFDFSYDQQVILQDARDYLSLHKNQYDLIIVDIFDNNPQNTPATQLPFIELLYDSLTLEGFLAVNMLGSSDTSNTVLLHPSYHPYLKIFPHACLIPCRYGAYVFYRALLGFRYDLDETLNIIGLFKKNAFQIQKEMVIQKAQECQQPDMAKYIQDIP